MRRLCITIAAVVAAAWPAAPARAQYLSSSYLPPRRSNDLTALRHYRAPDRMTTTSVPMTYWMTRTTYDRFQNLSPLNRLEFDSYYRYFGRSGRDPAGMFWSSYDYWFGPRTRLWQGRQRFYQEPRS